MDMMEQLSTPTPTLSTTILLHSLKSYWHHAVVCLSVRRTDRRQHDANSFSDCATVRSAKIDELLAVRGDNMEWGLISSNLGPNVYPFVDLARSKIANFPTSPRSECSLWKFVVKLTTKKL